MISSIYIHSIGQLCVDQYSCINHLGDLQVVNINLSNNHIITLIVKVKLVSGILFRSQLIMYEFPLQSHGG